MLNLFPIANEEYAVLKTLLKRRKITERGKNSENKQNAREQKTYSCWL